VKPGTWPQAFIRSQIVLLFSKDESRIKATVVDVKPVDYREYGRRLVMNIRRNAAM
jgi:replication factor A1